MIGVWLLLTLFGMYSAQAVSKRWLTEFSIPGYSAYETNQRTLQIFGSGEQAPLIAVFHTSGDVTTEDQIAPSLSRAQAVNPGSRISSYFSTGNDAYVSSDKHTTFATIYPAGTPGFGSESFIAKTRAALKATVPPGVTVNLTGRDPLENAGASGGGPSILTEGLIGGLGALVILFFVFGTLPAVAMPLVIAVASILNTFTLVWLLTYVTNVSIIVQFLIALVGLGVAIDYALLMIFRFRDELREGTDVETALVETMTHAGRSVIVSGSTVAVGLLSDDRPAAALHPLDRDRRDADPGRLGARRDHAAAGAAAVLGERINSVRVLPGRLVDQGHPEDGWWGRWARVRPAPAACRLPRPGSPWSPCSSSTASS